MKTFTLILIVIFVLGFLITWNATDIAQRPTRAETITICKELIKANSNTIFDKKNSGILEECLLTLIEIEYNEIELTEAKRKLKIQLQWLIDRNEQRIEEKNEKFKEAR